MPSWIDTHAHLDAAEFEADRDSVIRRAAAAGVGQIVLPAVEVGNFDAVRGLAHRHGLAYALGIHPLFVQRAHDDDLEKVQAALARHRDDPRLVAVGEIGLDHFVPGHDLARQERFYAAQLRMARDIGLPVLLHVRRSADGLLKHLRRLRGVTGIVHAFNGSEQQAEAFIVGGFKLGFGGAMTYERALQIRRLAAAVPEEAIVLETDAPDIPPHWLYRRAEERAAGATMRNEPAELPRIAETLAALRGWTIGRTAEITAANARQALPRLAGVTMPGTGSAPVNPGEPMGLLDVLIGAATGASPSPSRADAPGGLGDLLGGHGPALLQAVLGMLLAGRGQGGGSGGLADVLGRLRGGGLGTQVDSWVSTGDNVGVSGAQLQDALGGSDLLDQLARQLGMSQGDAASALSQVLPGVVDQLTPEGRVPAELPDASQLDLGEVVGRMLQGQR